MGRPTTGHRARTQGTLGLSPVSRDIDLFDFSRLYPSQPQTEAERVNRRIQEMLQPFGGQPASRERPMTRSELASRLSEVLGSIPTKIELQRSVGRIAVSASGATAELRTGPSTRVGATLSSGGTPGAHIETRSGELHARVSTQLGQPLRVETAYRDLRQSLTLTPDRWEIKVSWGSNAPDMTRLSDIFRRAQEGMVGILGAAGDVDLNDLSATTSAISPHLEPIKQAVRTAGEIASVREGISLSATASGPMTDRGRAEGFQVIGLVTIRF